MLEFSIKTIAFQMQCLNTVVQDTTCEWRLCVLLLFASSALSREKRGGYRSQHGKYEQDCTGQAPSGSSGGRLTVAPQLAYKATSRVGRLRGLFSAFPAGMPSDQKVAEDMRLQEDTKRKHRKLRYVESQTFPVDADATRAS